AGAPASRLQELHRRMLELQAQHVVTMRALDLPDYVVQGVDEAVRKVQPQARLHVAGLDLSHALFRLAVGIPVTDAVALRKEVEANSTKSGIQSSDNPSSVRTVACLPTRRRWLRHLGMSAKRLS